MTKTIQEAIEEVRRKSLVEQEPADIVDRSKKIEDQIRQSGAGQVAADVLKQAGQKAREAEREVDAAALGYTEKRSNATAPVGRAERGPKDKNRGETINKGEIDPTSNKYLEKVVKENDSPLIDAFLRLHELTPFERKFAQEMQKPHKPGSTFKWQGKDILLKYRDEPKAKPVNKSVSTDQNNQSQTDDSSSTQRSRGLNIPSDSKVGQSRGSSLPVTTGPKYIPGAAERLPSERFQPTSPSASPPATTDIGSEKRAQDMMRDRTSPKGRLIPPSEAGIPGTEPSARASTGDQDSSTPQLKGRLIKLPDSAIDHVYSTRGFNQLQRHNERQRAQGLPMAGIDESKTNNEQTDYVNPPGKLRMPKDMTGGAYTAPGPIMKYHPVTLPKDIAKAQPPVEVRPSDPERLKKPVATIPFQMKEYLDRTSGKPPMKEDISDTVKDLYNRAKEAITGSSKGNRLTPSEPERSTDIFKAAPGSKESIGISDYPGKNIGQGNKFSSRVPKDDDKPMSGISPAPKPMGNIAPAPKPKPYFDYQNRQYRGVPPHQTGKGRAIDSNRETYLEQAKPQSETPWSGGYHQSLQGTTGSGKDYSGQSGSTGPDYSDTTPKQKATPTTPKYEDGGKRKKMSEENSPIIDMFLKLQEKNALNPNIFEAAKKMSAKEKSLASLGHPKDKITKKDVLIGRGVLPKEVDEASIYSGKNPFAPGGPNSPIGPGGSENFGRAVTVEKEPKPARPADSAKPKSFVDPKNPTVQGSGDITFDGRPTRVKEGMEDIEAPKYRSAEDVKKAKQPNGYEYKFDTDTKSTFERMRGLSGKDAKVMEELKGNQHRIDANKNGKIDSEDFKLLRSKKKVEEEVEEIDEISVGTAYSYSGKKMEKEREGLLQGERNPTSKLQLKNMTNAANRTDKDYYKQRGFKKMEEEVELDELSKGTLGSYVKKASKDYISHNAVNTPRSKVSIEKKRLTGINRAADRLAKEEVEFSQAEIDHINSFLEAVAPNRPEPTKGVNPTVRNTDLTDETLEEGRPRKNPTPETTERDARQHIQVQAGRAAGGTVVDFKHDNGKVSKLTPGMGRAITAHLNGLKPAERQEAVKRMHASPEGLKV